MMERNTLLRIGAGIILLALVITVIAVCVTPEGVKIQNEYEESMVKADLESDYKTSIETETTLRSFKASYEADKITYMNNKDSEIREDQELARAAKTRANRTAATYNELLEHSLLDHIKFPEELEEKLEYIE